MLDGRTREGAEGEILAQVNSNNGEFSTSVFWITAHKKRGAAMDRLLKRGAVTADNSRGYPTVIIRLAGEANDLSKLRRHTLGL